MIRLEGLLRGSFIVLDIDPRLDLSFFVKGDVVAKLNGT